MPYIPNRDVDLVTWANNFVSLLTTDPNRYGIGADDALVLQGEYDDFAAAMIVIGSPDTRTPAAIAHKNGVKALLLADARYFAQYIKNLRGVSNEDKAALGLALPDPTPTPVPPPSNAPLVAVITLTAAQATFRMRNPDTPTSNAKPPGVTMCLLYKHVGETYNFDFSAAGPLLQGIHTKTPFVINLEPGETGKHIVFWGQWANRKGELGPISNPEFFVQP